MAWYYYKTMSVYYLKMNSNKGLLDFEKDKVSRFMLITF